MKKAEWFECPPPPPPPSNEIVSNTVESFNWPARFLSNAARSRGRFVGNRELSASRNLLFRPSWNFYKYSRWKRVIDVLRRGQGVRIFVQYTAPSVPYIYINFDPISLSFFSLSLLLFFFFAYLFTSRENIVPSGFDELTAREYFTVLCRSSIRGKTRLPPRR